MIHSQSECFMLAMWPLIATPALLNTMCAAPILENVCAARLCTDARLATSHTTPSAFAPDDDNSATALSSAPASISAITIFAPLAASALAVPNPIPLAPPVMTATFPLMVSMPHGISRFRQNEKGPRDARAFGDIRYVVDARRWRRA